MVVIFDRVESTKPEFEKGFLLHTVNKPIVNGNMTVTENNGGRLSCLTVLPEQATLKLVGGPGKEFWVNGVNYPIDEKAKTRSGLEPGAWRLEVIPKAEKTMHYFLHILFIDAANALPVDPKTVNLIKDENSAGILLGKWKLLFPFSLGEETTIEKDDRILTK